VDPIAGLATLAGTTKGGAGIENKKIKTWN
jgi:hypothetical protein